MGMNENNQPTEQFPSTSAANESLYDKAGRTVPQEFSDTTVFAAENEVAPLPVVEEEKAPKVRRGTLDFGLLILRVFFACYLVLTAIGLFFNLGGSGGLNQLKSDYAPYAYADTLTIGVPVLLLAAGVFLLVGLLTPVAAAVATIGSSFLFLNAMNSSDAISPFAWGEGAWLGLILVGISLALQFTGPGVMSFDTARGWATRPLVSSWIFVILGLAGGAALWWFGAGVNPFN